MGNLQKFKRRNLHIFQYFNFIFGKEIKNIRAIRTIPKNTFHLLVFYIVFFIIALIFTADFCNTDNYANTYIQADYLSENSYLSLFL